MPFAVWGKNASDPGVVPSARLSSDPSGAPLSDRSVTSSFEPADVGLFLTLSAMWGFSFLFIKVAVGQLSPVEVVAGRTLVGAAALLLILRARGGHLPRGWVIWGHLMVLATAGNAIPWTIFAWAEESIPSGLAAVINSLMPATTLAVAAAIGIERLTLRKVGGLVLAFTGTAIVVSGELGAPGRLFAVLGAVIATLFYAGATVYTKRFVSGRESPMVLATGQVLGAAVLSTGVALLLGPVPDLGALRWEVTGSVVALGVFGTGLAFLVFYALIERVGASNASMVTYLIPVVGLLAGWLILDETFGPHVLAGAAVIVAGIWLAQRERRAPSETAHEVEEVAA